MFYCPSDCKLLYPRYEQRITFLNLAIKKHRSLGLPHGNIHSEKEDWKYKNNKKKKKETHWDWPTVSEAIWGRPGYIIYYKLDKYKEIRRYISIYILQ